MIWPLESKFLQKNSTLAYLLVITFSLSFKQRRKEIILNKHYIQTTKTINTKNYFWNVYRSVTNQRQNQTTSREQQLAVIVTTCGPVATIEIMFTLIGVVAGPSVQVPLFHLLVNM